MAKKIKKGIFCTRQNDISKANVDYVIRLASGLGVTVEKLICLGG